MSSNNDFSCIKTSLFSATIENIIRQPLTAATVVMINDNKTLRQACVTLYSNGGIGRFYNGLQGFGISWTMRSVHRMTTFEVNQRMVNNRYSNSAIAIATTVAEVGTTSIGELILTLAQAPQQQGSMVALIQKRFKDGGFSSFTTGFWGNSARNIVFNGTLFGLKNNCTKQMNEHPIAMSAFISFNAVVLSHPMEVLRARKVKETDASYLEHAVKVIKDKGPRGFFQGVTPRIMSVGAGTFTMMVVFTALQNKL